jgi:hypothetical protein
MTLAERFAALPLGLQEWILRKGQWGPRYDLESPVTRRDSDHYWWYGWHGPWRSNNAVEYARSIPSPSENRYEYTILGETYDLLEAAELIANHMREAE